MHANWTVWRMFEAFCRTRNECACPASAQTIATYLFARAPSCSGRTLCSYLRSVIWVQELRGYHHLDPAQLRVVLERAQRGARGAFRYITPTTRDQLAAVVRMIDVRTLAGARDRALLLTSAAAWLEPQEARDAHTDWLAPVPSGILFTVPGRCARQLLIPRLERAIPLCPARALRWLLLHLGESYRGPLFPRVARDEIVAAAISDCVLRKLVRARGVAGGVPDLSLRGIRRGAMIAALEAGISRVEFERHAGYHDPTTYERFVKRVRRFYAAAEVS